MKKTIKDQLVNEKQGEKQEKTGYINKKLTKMAE